MPRPVLEIRNVQHRFGGRETLRGVDLAVEGGAIHGFLGRNGAGKTTTIRLVFGLLRLRRGEICIEGTSVRGHPPATYRRASVLFEDFAAPPYLSGVEFLRLRGKELGLPRTEAARAAGLWLERLGLAADGGRRTRAYSLGMRRRLGLAAALLGRPRLVVLDEPTNGLDPQGILHVRDIVAEQHREHGTTFLLSSHVLGEIERLCHAASILERGRIVRSGAITELIATATPRWRLRVRPLARARETLAAAGFAGEIAVKDDGRCAGGGEARDGTGTLELTLAPDVAPDAVRALVAAEVDVFELTRIARTLEDVFHDELAAAAAAAADAQAEGSAGVRSTGSADGGHAP